MLLKDHFTFVTAGIATGVVTAGVITLGFVMGHGVIGGALGIAIYGFGTFEAIRREPEGSDEHKNFMIAAAFTNLALGLAITQVVDLDPAYKNTVVPKPVSVIEHTQSKNDAISGYNPVTNTLVLKA